MRDPDNLVSMEEAIKLAGKTDLDLFMFALDLFEELSRSKSLVRAISGLYMAGYMQGKREERLKKKNQKHSS